MATEPEPGLPQFPDPLIEAGSHRSIWLFWLIPLVAIVVGGFLGLRALLDHGPVFRIEFISADGLEAGKTRVKYKNVDIGLVRTIDLIPDHSQVVVTAELTADELKAVMEEVYASHERRNLLGFAVKLEDRGMDCRIASMKLQDGRPLERSKKYLIRLTVSMRAAEAITS